MRNNKSPHNWSFVFFNLEAFSVNNNVFNGLQQQSLLLCKINLFIYGSSFRFLKPVKACYIKSIGYVHIFSKKHPTITIQLLLSYETNKSGKHWGTEVHSKNISHLSLCCVLSLLLHKLLLTKWLSQQGKDDASHNLDLLRSNFCWQHGRRIQWGGGIPHGRNIGWYIQGWEGSSQGKQTGKSQRTSNRLFLCVGVTGQK